MGKTFKEKLKNAEKTIGIFLKTFDEPDIAKLIKNCGFDFFVLDNEHGFFDYNRMKNLMLYAKAIDMFSMVRIPEVSREVVLKCMEMGAGGLILPNTESVKQAQDLVRYSKYSPMGDRGVSLFGVHSHYESINNVEYMKKANYETVLCVQIESPLGLENLPDIMSIDGIDFAFVGPADYTQSMGIPGKVDAPEFLNHMERLIEICKNAGKVAGIHGGTVEAITEWYNRGMTVNTGQSEVGYFLNAAKGFVEQTKAKF